jgi:flagellar hook-associated protein 2
MRIGGLASGMDIDKIVGDLMKAERIPLDKLNQKKQTLEWKRDAYRDINKQLQEMDDYLFNNLVLSSNFYKKTVSSSNEAAVSATANSSSYDGTSTINSVTQIAKSSYGTSTTYTGGGSKTLQEITGAAAGAEVSFTLESVQSDGTMKSQEFKFDSSATLSDVANEVNKSGLGVSIIVSDQGVSISSRHTGEANDGGAEIRENGSSFFQNLGFNSSSIADNGQNAVFSLNGLQMEKTSNTFTVNGVSYTLKQETATAVTFNTSTDVDGMMEKITEFVDKYNKLVTSLNDLTKEKRYRDFPPLTDAQKEDMEEKEIELWEEKAKSGLLRSDSIISSGLIQMRQQLYSEVDGIGNIESDHLTEIGITTSKDVMSGGTLVIDPDKLRKALEKDSQSVYELFSKSGERTENADGTYTDTRGLAQGLRDVMKGITRNIEEKAGKVTQTNDEFTLGKQLTSTENSIDDFQRRLQNIENRYWRQFTAMEKAIQKANSQSAYLMQQFGGM